MFPAALLWHPDPVDASRLYPAVYRRCGAFGLSDQIDWANKRRDQQVHSVHQA